MVTWTIIILSFHSQQLAKLCNKDMGGLYFGVIDVKIVFNVKVNLFITHDKIKSDKL